MEKQELAHLFKNIITSSPYTIHQTALLSWLISGDSLYGKFFALSVSNELLNVMEKWAMRRMAPSKWGKRPNGCGTNMEGCGIFPSNGKCSTSWGMPSGHAQITSCAAMFWTLHILKQRQLSRIGKEHAVVVVLWLLVCVVCSQRVHSQCHSVPQVVCGVLVGSLVGYIGSLCLDPRPPVAAPLYGVKPPALSPKATPRGGPGILGAL